VCRWTCHTTQTYFLDSEPTSICLILILIAAYIAEKQQIYTNFIVFGLIRLGFEHTIYHIPGEHANNYTTDAIYMYMKRDKNKDYKYNVQKSSRHVISRVCNDLKISEKNVHHKVGMKYPVIIKYHLCRSKRGKDIQFKYDCRVVYMYFMLTHLPKDRNKSNWIRTRENYERICLNK
jgi:hypothetical protein